MALVRVFWMYSPSEYWNSEPSFLGVGVLFSVFSEVWGFLVVYLSLLSLEVSTPGEVFGTVATLLGGLMSVLNSNPTFLSSAKIVTKL